MTKLIAANWKENPRTEIEASKLFKVVAKAKRKNADVVICPPFIYLESIAKTFKGLSSKTHLALGAQDVFFEDEGAFTSEVGPKMIRSLGAKYVILGHSEVRKWNNETDAIINKKIKLALQDGLKIILCVGEPLPIREQGIAATKKFIQQQLVQDLKGIELKSGNLFIAYEPIWAIGTGKSDTTKDAEEMALFIKSFLKEKQGIRPKFLYGGSVNSKNVASYIQLKDVDGALVGGASLKANEFIKIINTI
jgi:triosephosphate isomerase